jgi:hypothetical protein
MKRIVAHIHVFEQNYVKYSAFRKQYSSKGLYLSWYLENILLVLYSVLGCHGKTSILKSMDVNCLKLRWLPHQYNV